MTVHAPVLRPAVDRERADRVERALATALERVRDLATPALVAQVEREAACRTHATTGVSRTTRDRLVSDVLPPSDDHATRTGTLEGSDGRAWTRAVAPVGADAAVVAAAAGTLDPLGVARLEAVALGLARDVALDRERRTGERLRHLLATAGRAVASLDLDEVLSGIVRDATLLLEGDSGDMLLLDDAARRLRVVAVWNFPPEMLGFELARGEGISWEAITRRAPLQTPDYRTYERRSEALDGYRFGAVVCVPLVFRNEAIGTINVHSGVPGQRFSTADLDLLAAFADHAAIAVDHARRFRNEVHLGEVLAETNRELSRSLAVQQRLAEQVILDGGPSGIAEVLAHDLGRRVVIEDHLHRRIAEATPVGRVAGADPAPRPRTRERAATAGPREEPYSVAVRVGREVVGHLVMSSEGELGPIDRALIGIATTGVALEFAKLRAAIVVEERLQGEAAGDLLSGNFPSEEAIAARAARLGYDLGEPRDLMVVDVATAGPDASDAAARWLALVRERLAVLRPGSLAVIHGGRLVILATLGTGRGTSPEALLADLRAALESDAAVTAVTIAVGRRCTRPADFAPAFRAATDALELMLKLGRAGATVGPRELGAYALLLEATPSDGLRAFAERTLRPLVEHDRTHPGDLLRTLRVHLEVDRVQRRTAERCFIHVNTVVYRIRRIEELLGRSLDDPSAVFDLTLALRIHDVLADDGTAGGTVRPRA